jgi:hypothetical protein
MAWGVPLIGAVAETTVSGGNLTLAEHASAADGMLQVAFIAYRSNAAFSPPAGEGWTICGTQQSSGDTDATQGIASAVMYWRKRAGAGTRIFTRTLGDVAQGVILSYPVDAGFDPVLDVASAATLAVGGATVTTPSLTTAVAAELIVAGCSVGDAFNVSAFDAATDPATASGTTNTTSAPTAGTWFERVDTSTTTGADSGIAVADAVRATAGATGTIQCTSATTGRSAMIAAAFKMVATPITGTSALSQGGHAVAASGTMTAAPAVTGTSALSQGGHVMAASGTTTAAAPAYPPELFRVRQRRRDPKLRM